MMWVLDGFESLLVLFMRGRVRILDGHQVAGLVLVQID